MLTVNANKRFTAEQALQSDWFKKTPGSVLRAHDLSGNLQELKKMQPKTAWKRAVHALGFNASAPFWNPDATSFSQQLSKWDQKVTSEDTASREDDDLPPIPVKPIPMADSRATSAASILQPSTVMNNLHRNLFADYYELKTQLRKGSYATVWECIHKASGKKFACKVIQRQGLKPKDDEAVLNEVAVMQTLAGNKYVVQLLDFYEEPDFFYLVMEYCVGGDVFERIVKYTQYTEADARDLAVVLLKAIDSLHRNNIAHRDIKPQNLLLLKHTDNWDIKIADFGFARRVHTPESLTSRVGTPTYVAPEILKNLPHDHRVDLWSAGVVIFVLLVGYPPFLDEDQTNLFRKIRNGEWEFYDEDWKNISQDAKDLIKGLLVVDPADRFTVREALRSNWIKQSSSTLSNIDLTDSLKVMKQKRARLRSLARAFMGSGDKVKPVEIPTAAQASINGSPANSKELISKKEKKDSPMSSSKESEKESKDSSCIPATGEEAGNVASAIQSPMDQKGNALGSTKKKASPAQRAFTGLGDKVKSSVNAMAKTDKKESPSNGKKDTNKSKSESPLTIGMDSYKDSSAGGGLGGGKKKANPAQRALTGLGDKVKSSVNSAMGKKEKKENQGSSKELASTNSSKNNSPTASAEIDKEISERQIPIDSKGNPSTLPKKKSNPAQKALTSLGDKVKNSFSAKDTNKGSPPTPSCKKNDKESNASVSTCSKSVSAKDGLDGENKKKVSTARALLGLGDKVKSGVNSAMGKKEKKPNLVDKPTNVDIDAKKKNSDESLGAVSAPHEANVSLARCIDNGANDTLSIPAEKEPTTSDECVTPASLSDTSEGAFGSAVSRKFQHGEKENPTNESHTIAATWLDGCEKTDEQTIKVEMNAMEKGKLFDDVCNGIDLLANQVQSSQAGSGTSEKVTFPPVRNGEYKKECNIESEKAAVSDECPTSEIGTCQNDVDIGENTERCHCNTSNMIPVGEERGNLAYSTPDRKLHAEDAQVLCDEKVNSPASVETNSCCIDKVVIPVSVDLHDKSTFDTDTCNGQGCKKEYSLEESTGEKETSTCEQAKVCALR